jgi:hypothetical protein
VIPIKGSFNQLTLDPSVPLCPTVIIPETLKSQFLRQELTQRGTSISSVKMYSEKNLFERLDEHLLGDDAETKGCVGGGTR